MSKYIDSVLGTGEKVMYEAKVSIWSLWPLLLAGLVTLPLFGVGLLFFAAAALKYMNTDLVITDKRIYGRFGLIDKNEIAVSLTKTKSVEIEQFGLGRRFNYGSITISGPGVPKSPVQGIDAPAEFSRKFETIRKKGSPGPLKRAA